MMENQFYLLYYLSSVTGLIMVAGGIFLLYTEKIYIDSQTKEVTTLETPVGTFRTHAPALTLFLIGFIPLIYPIYQSSKDEEKVRLALEDERQKLDEKVTLQGEVIGKKSSFPVQAYVVLKSDSLLNEGQYSFSVPAHSEDEQYKLIFYMNDKNIKEKKADLKKAEGGRITLNAFRIQTDEDSEVANSNYNTPEVQVIDIPEEFRD
ncbi:MAG: hypothetical protein D3906_09180 [Candidatus Electrothrix sp. AUS1_2]|nr:hypothetical protein [Candidatus Electrothrix sp. AUS1_2]